MIEKNNWALVGYQDAVLVHDLKNVMGPIANISVIEPDMFFEMTNSEHNGYMILITRDMVLRKKLVDHVRKYQFPTFNYVHPTATILDDCLLGNGCFVGPYCFIASQAKLQDHCFLGPYSMISHRCTIGTGTVFHPNTMIAGSTQIGEYCKFNFRTAAIDHITVADMTEVGATGVVTKSITEPNGVYVGTPARRIRKQGEEEL